MFQNFYFGNKMRICVCFCAHTLHFADFTTVLVGVTIDKNSSVGGCVVPLCRVICLPVAVSSTLTNMTNTK